MSRTTHNQSKRGNTVTDSPCAKRHSLHEQPAYDIFSSDNDCEVFDDAPLTKMDIPKIVGTVMSKFCKESGEGSEEGEEIHDSLRLDLDYISVISSCQKRAPQPTNHLVTAALSTGSSILPVPSSIVAKIESGKFVEMADLVPNHLGFENTAGTKSKQRAVANISECLEAFAIYVSIIASKQPQRVPDLIGYQILMMEASNEYHKITG